MNAPRVTQLGFCAAGERCASLFLVTFNRAPHQALLVLESEAGNHVHPFDSVPAALVEYDRRAAEIVRAVSPEVR